MLEELFLAEAVGTAFHKEIGTEAQVADEVVAGGGVFFEVFVGEGRADDDLDSLAFEGEELAGEEDGAQEGVDEADGVEEEGVAAGEVEGDGGGACFTDEAGDLGGPFGVAYAEGLFVEAGDFARGEDEEHVAVFEPAEGFFDGADVGGGGAFGGEGVDEDEVVMHFVDGAEEVVGHGFDVGAQAVEQGEEEDAFDAAEGVVADDDNGAGLGDGCEVFGGIAVIDTKNEEGFFAEGHLGGEVPHAGVDSVHLAQAEDTFNAVVGEAQEETQDGVLNFLPRDGITARIHNLMGVSLPYKGSVFNKE